MKITPEKVQELAALSRLKFEGEAAERMRQDLENILEMCEKLNEVNTDGVEPLIYMTDRVNNLREDKVEQEITHEEALKNAPKKDSDFFRVPKVIGQTD
ncbi:MAG: Asp-tRNA(Asn)/Glu-tRNA(Gln) amidotransferase subunit GatC [Bacteroidetes bacterium]|jgi:aspartyl-tRNA(Asn)/glutamyl-tRNA(Gln) amidotransferase subunit C|nr:Asp-tRNA(Asn)/Glu-tRNA(Gln) amidotransferase subunit GatC [Bacteroidota bacterium]